MANLSFSFDCRGGDNQSKSIHWDWMQVRVSIEIKSIKSSIINPDTMCNKEITQPNGSIF